ncbi:hypothetical protein [Elizabethkingia anophelis]|uniref:hypothetical protein n=1 Tax=Elizabethkingia anophelis TaxID=1117645 RepID=UPI0024E26235|nr:hypothetical protein [Elizabethkingia anophelis]MCT4162130.1 hypothetical protein [Elizabethkingia anophelis]CAH1144058.1 hypothetical protein EAVNVB490_01614 [Elizabethkingia anophelis]CAI9670537.1 hypothetical protein EAVNNN508_01613 [Elizabethkingia anophelis]CAI9673187.1 hypothetical protein EAVNVB490_00549 [Elizabethkingia anophelis]CAI9678075.1 hypothetical protein EAVNNN508_00547 [Elizabethkingia anophelis]
MKKIYLFVLILIFSIFFGQSKSIKPLDCSNQLKNLLKDRVETAYGTIYDYHINSFEKSTVSDLNLTTAASSYYIDLSLDYIKKANEFYAKNDYSTGDSLKKESNINYKKSSTMSSLSSSASASKKNIIAFDVKYSIKAEDKKDDGDYKTTFYFNKKCKNLSMDDIYDYIIQNVDR